MKLKVIEAIKAHYVDLLLPGLSVCWSVGRSVGLSVCPKDGKLNYYTPLGALVSMLIWKNHVIILLSQILDA